MKQKYTPGPWKINPLRNPTNPEYFCVYVKPGDHTTVKHIAVVDSKGVDGNREENEANAKLIGAAPDLLAACELILHRIKQQAGPDGKYPDSLPAEIWACEVSLTAAIKKAKGEQP